MLPSGGVRVKLDLSDFVLDVGARRWILLVPGKMVQIHHPPPSIMQTCLKFITQVTVGDLLEKIRGEYGQVRKIMLDSIFNLLPIKVKEEDTLTVFLEEQFMVPPWEPLCILKEGDLLRVTLSQGAKEQISSSLI